MRHIVVLGGGITGLSCAARLLEGFRVTLLEKRPTTGGLAASFRYRDFILDLGPHKLYSQLPGIMPLYSEILQGKVLTVKKTNSLHLFGKNFSFPLQPIQFLRDFPKKPLVEIGAGFAAARVRSLLGRKRPESYEEYFIAGFGLSGYHYVFHDICQKIWGDPRTISSEMAVRRVPVPSLTHLLQTMVDRKKKEQASAASFCYPSEGGVGTVCDSLRAEIEGTGVEVLTNATPLHIRTMGKRYEVTFQQSGGGRKRTRRIPAAIVISTIHLKDFLGLFAEVPSVVKEAADALHYRSLLLCYFILNAPSALKDTWVYFPEKRFMFSRVSEMVKFGAHTCPTGKTALMVEVPCEHDGELYHLPRGTLRERILADLDTAGIPVRETMLDFFTIKINRMYPVYDREYRTHLATVLDWVDNLPGVYTIGRQGLFNYSNTDHSLDMAQRCAAHILAGRNQGDWSKEREYFDTYRIVD